MTPSDRTRLLAESAARVYALTSDDAIASVRLGRETPAQAYARCRRKYESLRKNYFRDSPFEATDAAWDEHGPKKAHAEAYERLLGSKGNT